MTMPLMQMVRPSALSSQIDDITGGLASHQPAEVERVQGIEQPSVHSIT